MFDLRPYQEPIAPKVFKYLRNNKGKNPLVAAPTGSGKTVILAEIVRQALEIWPDVCIVVLSHVKEILEQDRKALSFHLNRKIGVYSVGLGTRDIQQVTVAGIQSVHKKADLFNSPKLLVIIDECHLIPPGNDTMYRRFLLGLDVKRVIGLTATPFRLKGGYIYGQPDSIFDDCVVDLTTKARFLKLIKDGYLCKLKATATHIELDPKDIRTIGGDFDNKQLSNKFDVKSITKRAVTEIIKTGANYKKWLLFAIDIEHAEHIAEELSEQGIPTMVVHSKMEFDRSTVIEHYKSGTFRAIVNVNVLTTGFDDPEIDLIALLRPTKSPVIHVQTIGRGLRIAPNKDHCLILDFAGNTERLGPINDITVKKPKKGKKGGEPITKRCPACDTIHAPAVRVCEWCGHKFVFKTELVGQSSSSDIIAGSGPSWYKVDDVIYTIHRKASSPDMMKVTYKCGLRSFQEYICVEHKGYAGHRAHHWLTYRGMNDVQNTSWVVMNAHLLMKPTRIYLDTSGRYPTFKDYEF